MTIIFRLGECGVCDKFVAANAFEEKIMCANFSRERKYARVKGALVSHQNLNFIFQLTQKGAFVRTVHIRLHFSTMDLVFR